LFAPIPKGLSHKIGIPHIVGGLVPDAKLVAAVWEDGSTFGPGELLARISDSRKSWRIAMILQSLPCRLD